MHAPSRIPPLFLSLTLALLSVHSTLAQDVLTKKSDASAKSGSATKEGFVSLFNGKNLDNWVQRRGKAKYSIEGDAIVGTSTLNTPNTFLCTPRDYGDFILELDFKVDDGLNSGIQIRSHSFDKETTVEYKNAEGKMATKKIPAKRVHGYQVEIDPSDRGWSAGIYDEARRGWLNDLSKNKAAREAFKHNEWNHYRIEAAGDSIKTWINGVPAADLTDDMTAEGFIALQVHGIGNNKELEGKQVRWRNVMLKELNGDQK